MASTRTKTEIAERRVKVASRYLKGESQPQIARALKVSQFTISTDLAAIREEWKEQAQGDVRAFIGDSLARIDALELEAWQAWQRSVGKHTKRTEKTEPPAPPANGNGNGHGKKKAPVPAPEVTITTEELTGDPRFLERVAWCIDRRCRLLGLDAPKRVDMTSGGLPITKVVSPDVADAV